MAISDLGLFSALKARMDWLQRRQTLLAENVANADTPNFRARDLAPLEVGPAVLGKAAAFSPLRTHSAHLNLRSGPAGGPRAVEGQGLDVRPSGNSVVLEEEMMKVAETQIDYQLVTSLYGRGIGIIKTALGRRA